DDGIRHGLHFFPVRSDPVCLGIKRAAGILASEDRQRVLLAARITKNLELPVLAQQDGNRRIEQMAASTVPCSIAATAVAPRPTPITPTEFGSTPFLLNMYLRKKSVEDPGALTPTFLLARSLIELISEARLGETTNAKPG